MEDANKPKRRVRYKGTHPKKFTEKYKELNPEKYGADIEKVISRGATPAGTHRPICVDEIIEVLNPQPGSIVLDATLGFGGHASALLERVLPSGRLIGLDQDPIERPKTEARLREKGFGPDVFTVGAVNFRDARKFLDTLPLTKVDMVLADLGLSSMQIDGPERGFSFKTDQPLDLRMNPTVGYSAAEFIKTLSEERLTKILEDNADELRARHIAHAIIDRRPASTFELVEAVREGMKGCSTRVRTEEGDSPIRRAMQALRIELNDEFGALDKFLSDLPRILKHGGRVAILSFHSGEDRRVKKSFQALERSGVYVETSPDPIRPSSEEQRSNPRSKSAKLRWARLR